MDPGPYGCLGSGPGYALAAKLARPDRDVCLLLGDGAFGFSGLEFDTRCATAYPIVAVMGNNGIWALAKYPDGVHLTATRSRPTFSRVSATRRVVEALGGHGELVERRTSCGARLSGPSSPASQRSSTC